MERKWGRRIKLIQRGHPLKGRPQYDCKLPTPIEYPEGTRFNRAPINRDLCCATTGGVKISQKWDADAKLIKVVRRDEPLYPYPPPGSDEVA